MAEDKRVLDEKALEHIVAESGVPDRFKQRLREAVADAFLQGVKYSHSNTTAVERGQGMGYNWHTWAELERTYSLSKLGEALEKYKKR